MSVELFRTTINVPASERKIGYDKPLMLIGSCFTENIGEKLAWYKFPLVVNPFGIVYNPLSVKNGLSRLMEGRKYVKEELHHYNGLFFSFDHHSKFSDVDPDVCLKKINNSFSEAVSALKNTSVLFITFGTSFYYTLHPEKRIVSNCHKLPAGEFNNEMLEVEDIVNDYRNIIPALTHLNPEIFIVFTVSPIRHWKDGAHPNQLSKAVLILAIDKLCKEFSNTAYFPAYELLLDELRDYRFYDEDMLHPNKTAIEFIWKRFSNSFISSETMQIMNEVGKIQAAKQHRPFNTKNEAFYSFVQQQIFKIKQIVNQYPSVDLSSELQHFNSWL